MTIDPVTSLHPAYRLMYKALFTGLVLNRVDLNESTESDETLTIGYDTIRDVILTCARKLTQFSLIYRTKVSVPPYFVLIGYRHCSESCETWSLSSLSSLLLLRTTARKKCETDAWKSKKN